ncbi:hypothetical protein HYW87_00935 [Candidatus Roizmanbacteria bacterium]|nr:hypothetical protein [Candidatus Roizmanbacteria bacterium]
MNQTTAPAPQENLTKQPLKPFNFKVIFPLILIVAVLSSLITYLFLQSKYAPQTITSTIPPTHYESSQPYPKDDNTDETANWKTYENIENGYSIKYPSSQLARLICPDEELILQKRVPGNEQIDEKPLPTCGRDARFDIEVQTYSILPEELSTNKDYIISKEAVTIANKTADKYIVVPSSTCYGMCSPEWREEIRLVANGKTYTFHLWNKDLSGTFDQILSTFKFLE